MKRAFYSDSIDNFLQTPTDTIIGRMAEENPFSLVQEQRNSWVEEISFLKEALSESSQKTGAVYLEFSIPRMGLRVDAVVLLGGYLFVIEFKLGKQQLNAQALDQVYDYALDLKNFHETSHASRIVPLLVITGIKGESFHLVQSCHQDNLFKPILCRPQSMGNVFKKIVDSDETTLETMDPDRWINGRYSPTPTIIEAARALYNGHSVAEISRSDAGAINLTRTSEAIKRIIDDAREHQKKAICFVTGVPGAGKTLVGLNTATKPGEQNDSLSVFLSGNGPLVKILVEALARDKVARTKREQRRRITKKMAASEVRAFIQNVHHFRDECLRDRDRPPVEHIALFDEAQRAWNLEQTRSFMKRKKNVSEFVLSEPEFLISCMDRHPDWAVIVCLVGGGQEINRGEAGIREWLEAVQRRFSHWNIYLSSRLTDSEYDAETVIAQLPKSISVYYNDDLHLAVSIRSFRSENVSLLVKQILDLQIEQAQKTFRSVVERFPIVLTRDLQKAKEWLRSRARGSERFGIVASSNATRLKPDAIDVKSPMDPVHWFLDGKEDVRSSYYLEDVATEFAIQGLELDWVCMNWDADFRFNEASWDCWSFCGKKWQRIHKIEKQQHLKNAHRVLLTRARQGMVIVVPPGSETDPTRSPQFYDGTYRYLQKIGFEEI